MLALNTIETPTPSAMKFTSSALAAFLLVATSPVVTSFLPAATIPARATGGVSEALFLAPEDLTNYMVKAHEEKLRAIKEVEAKKDGEIQTLKSEVTELKEEIASVPKESAVVLSTPPTPGADLSNMTTEQLRAKLVQYQDFMAKYIVQAQHQKMKAVQAAEAATAAKYEEKIKFLLAGAPPSDSSSTTVPAPKIGSAETKLYDTRSATVAAAGKAGKSRWGDKEVAKVKMTEGDVKTDALNGTKMVNGVAETATATAPIGLPGSDVFDKRNQKIAAAGKAGKSRWGEAEVKKATETASAPSLSSAPAAPVTKEIEEADHGLRNDGGVGGPSLAERVNLGQQLFTGSDAATATATPPPATEIAQAATLAPPSVYDLRNARIARAAAAGKSRWGTAENSKATDLTVASNALSGSQPAAAAAAVSAAAKQPEIVSTPEIEAADHGLRNDGGVGGPSLAERVNLGSGLLKD